MMKSNHFSREREFFHEALDQPSTEARAVFIERATAGSPRLNGVKALLLEHNQVDAVFEQRVAALPQEGCIFYHPMEE